MAENNKHADHNEQPQSREKLTHLLAEFESPGALIEAAKRVRDEGYEKWDSHSPFPVHGIDPAMGIKPTILPMLVFAGGFGGLCIAIFIQWYFNSQVVPDIGIFSGWHWTVSGKPTWSIPANVPIAFELTILLAAFATFLGMWGLNKLPQVWHPLFNSTNFLRASDDSFFISIEAEDSKFDRQKTSAFLADIGGSNVEQIKVVTGPATRKLPKMVIGFVIVTASLSLVPLAFIAKARASTSAQPHVHIIPNMDFQPKAGAQDDFGIFVDDRATQLYPDGTVARGADSLRESDEFFRGIKGDDWTHAFPKEVPLTMTTMKRGENRYKIYCAPCHGQSGDGQGVIANRADAVGAPTTGWSPPSNLLEAQYVKIPHGQIFNTISYGIRTMPGYRAQIPEADRWAIVFYLRALQRAECESASNIEADKRGGIKGQRPDALITK